MPTTRRRSTRRPGAGLSSAMTEMFLVGVWPRNADGTRPLGRLPWFLMTDAEVRALWLEHRPSLLAEWRRRSGAGLPWGSRFDDGEASRFSEEWG